MHSQIDLKMKKIWKALKNLEFKRKKFFLGCRIFVEITNPFKPFYLVLSLIFL